MSEKVSRNQNDLSGEENMSSAAEMTLHMRVLCKAKNAPKKTIAWGDVARDMTAIVRNITGKKKRRVTPTTVRDHWYGYRETADADELTAARKLAARQQELEAQREAQRQATQLLMVANRLEEVDSQFHRDDIAALKRAAACVGVQNRPLADK